MKKHLTLFICTILFWGWATAQTPNLVVKSSMDPSLSGIYTHQGKFNNRDFWRGPQPNQQFYIAYSKNQSAWVLGQWYGDTSMMWMDFYYSASTDKYPTNGWNGNLDVKLEGPSLNYSSLELIETSKNDGSFDGKIIVSHNKFNGQTFAGQNGDDFISKNYAKTINLSTGLTASILRLSDSTLELSLSGKATTHNLDTNFIIEFNNDALANGGKADSTQDITKKIGLNFVNVINVAKMGGDFSTIDSGFDAMSNDDIMMVAEGIYTEYDIMPPSSLLRFTLIGKGADKTIIQADTAPGIAKGRVFTIGSASIVTFEGVTVQNGQMSSTNAYGGGIMIQSGTLTLRNCRILNNRALSSNSGQTIAGGIYCNNLNIYNTEIAGNSADNGNKTGQVMGGGFYAAGRCHIENSTISGNFSRDVAGGGLLGNNGFNKAHQIINSTISNNEATNTNGGGINTYYTVSITNSIIYGNKSVKGKDVYQTNGHVYPIGVTKSFVGDVLGMQDKANIKGIPFTTDPLLDTLKFNCGVTRTHALLEGSPARDSGVMSDSTPVLDQRGFAKFLNKDIGAHEEVYQTQFEIGQDSICLESTDLITLNGQPDNGVFEGTGVSGNTFDVSKVKTEGYVVITYKYTAPGCDNFSSSDSIYVYTCKVNGVYNPNLTVRVYPNPANDVLWIENSKNASMNVIILDLSGKQMMNAEQVTGKSSLNISELPAGVYFLTIESNGKKAYQKFIKL